MRIGGSGNEAKNESQKCLQLTPVNGSLVDFFSLIAKALALYSGKTRITDSAFKMFAPSFHANMTSLIIDSHPIRKLLRVE